MKNILKGTIIFGVCLTLAACGMENPREITVQSITEPVTTVQTVRNVPETTAVTESTVGTVMLNTEDWTELVATEPDDPNAGVPEPEYAGVTLPDAVDADMPSTIIVDMFRQELPDYSTGTKAGESTYDECNECYKKFLVEKLYDGREKLCDFFGGAYYSDGRLILMITDQSQSGEIFSDFFDGLESVEVVECKYPYVDLYTVHCIAEANEKVTLHFINMGTNRVEVGGELTEEDMESLRAEIEAAGLDPEAAEIVYGADAVPLANPC